MKNTKNLLMSSIFSFLAIMPFVSADIKYSPALTIGIPLVAIAVVVISIILAIKLVKWIIRKIKYN